MKGGASIESQYPPNKEVSCAVCGSDLPVFTRWGSRTCPTGSTKLYEGFIATSHYNDRGGGYTHLCMHPNPQWHSGTSTSNQDSSNRLYGVEYESQGSNLGSRHVNHDAACVVCQKKKPYTLYIQWGRTTCSSSHKTEYSGLVMSTKHDQKKSANLCVDVERAYHPFSSSSDDNGGRLYVSEIKDGAMSERTYPPNRE